MECGRLCRFFNHTLKRAADGLALFEGATSHISLLSWFFSSLRSGFDSAACLLAPRLKLFFIGLDNSGKTTLCHILSECKLRAHPPTTHPETSNLWIGNCKWTIVDCGGMPSVRRFFRRSLMMREADAFVFMVDATDKHRLMEARAELLALLGDDSSRGKPILVLGNKIDSPIALSEATLRELFGLPLESKKQRRWHAGAAQLLEEVMLRDLAAIAQDYNTCNKPAGKRDIGIDMPDWAPCSPEEQALIAARFAGAQEEDPQAMGRKEVGELFMSSAVRRVGYGEGFMWLQSQIEMNDGYFRCERARQGCATCDVRLL